MRTRLSTWLLGLLVLTIGASSALAGDEVRQRGSCSGGPSEWRLRVEREDDTSLRVRFDIEGGASGQVWQLFLSDDGERIYAATKESGDGGEVRARRLTADRDGTDRIKATGVNLDTGESCAGRVRA
jgi:hypothetical protein